MFDILGKIFMNELKNPFLPVTSVKLMRCIHKFASQGLPTVSPSSVKSTISNIRHGKRKNGLGKKIVILNFMVIPLIILLSS